MSMTDFSRVIAVSLELAGYADRGLTRVTPDEIHDTMTARNIPESYYEDVFILTDALMGFAMNVRAAERKKRAIVPVAGETDLPLS